MLIDACVSYLLLCLGGTRVSAGCIPRVDASGWPACELCGRRLSKVKHHRPYGNGRACHPRCKTHNTADVVDASLHAAAVGDPAASSLSPTTKQPTAQLRTKRPYDQLGSTQRWKRRKKAREALQQIDCPLQALIEQPTTTPAQLIHLPTSVREQIRTVPSIHIPSEQTMIDCKLQLSSTHATATGTFVGGAYMTDPLAYVSVLCAQSSFLAVGGDCGGGQTKLGITYTAQDTQMFACLLVYEGEDSWLELQDCRAQGLTPFIGDSVAFPHIWAVLQHLIDTRGAFLNGDWCFINAVLGLMSPSATHPCPICIVSKRRFTCTSRYRQPADKHSMDHNHSRLLTINPERIVPTPLHLFLGISNRIIMEVFTELLGKEHVEEVLKQVTTVHSAGCGGKSDVYDLNGPEIRKWIKKDCCTMLLAAASATQTPTSATTATVSLLKGWLQKLHDHLLHKKDWKSADIEAWRAAVDDIQQNWQEETNSNPFPKLHMLRHSLEFAERHRFLGRASEAQIESFHATFNALFHKQHRNQAGNTAERLRRSLADVSLRAVQPVLTQFTPM